MKCYCSTHPSIYVAVCWLPIAIVNIKNVSFKS